MLQGKIRPLVVVGGLLVGGAALTGCGGAAGTHAVSTNPSVRATPASASTPAATIPSASASPSAGAAATRSTAAAAETPAAPAAATPAAAGATSSPATTGATAASTAPAPADKAAATPSAGGGGPELLVRAFGGSVAYAGRRPSTIAFSVDSTNIVEHLSWSSWGPAGAVGHGSVGRNDCRPNCASGTVTQVPATIHLGGVVDGHFTTMTEQATDGTERTYSYPSNWATSAS